MAKPRTKKAITKATEQQSSKLLEALRYLSLVTKDIGTPNETHVYLGFKWAIAYNGTLTAAQSIPEDIYCCPHNSTLVNALSKCGQNLSITQLDINRLSIKSDKFKAIIPCIDPTLYHLAKPDLAIITIDDSFKIGLDAVSCLVSEDSQRIELGSILMNGKSLISSNGVMIFEYWHGLDLPPGIALPKTFANVLAKSTKKLKAFGFSQFSITVYFDDDSWLKTQLYVETWPDVSTVLDRKANAWPVPADLFRAIETIEKFSPTGLLYSRDGCLHSHTENGTGASFECPGIPAGLTFSARQMALLKPWVEVIDFFAEGPNNTKCIKAMGKNMRGLIAGRADG